MNATSQYELTIIVPIYNEEDNARALEQRLGDYLPTATRPACVLFVNDGSKDSSERLIAEICSRHQDMFYISFEKNCGLSAAIKAGIDAAESPLVGYIDADLQTAPEDFNLLLPYADEYELVMGIRANRKDSGFKKIQSRIANSFRRFMTGDDAVDTGCPLKILHTDVAKRIPMFTGMHRFLPALVGLQEGKVKQVPVRHFPRTAGVSKFSLRNRLIGPTMDCFAFRWMRPRWYNYRIGKTNLK
ncbi:MAG: glycosyltransferase [Muribaculaceae bacterium]|nr:glycosyltransferase [Bacteroidales bacterium]MDY2733087.1 glycosyltransferase [Muribaculaceae bacterium]MDY5387623.1 glycosyltransferase [Muribaculaceae bacterium]